MAAQNFRPGFSPSSSKTAYLGQGLGEQFLRTMDVLQLIEEQLL
jgi:hypothetical protein